MYTNRIKDLELQVSKQMHDHAESEKRLRREIEVLMNRHTELETKIIEATSQMGSEDSTSLASDSTMPLHSLMATSGNTHTDDRIAFLEKELNHYRTQYELLKINDTLRMDEMLSSQSNAIMQNSHNSNNNNNQSQQRKVLSSQSSTSTSSSMSNNNNHSTFVNYPTSSQSSKSSPCQNSKR